MEPGFEMSRKRNSCQSEGTQIPLPLIGTVASPSPNGEACLDDPAALEIVAGYHERTKHHYHRFAAAQGYMDWATQPDPFRRYDGAALVRLPLPENGRALPYWQLFGVKQHSALATIRIPSSHLVAAGSGSWGAADVFAPFAVSNR